MIKQYRNILWLAMLFVSLFSYGAGRTDSTFVVSADPPYSESQYLYQVTFNTNINNIMDFMEIKFEILDFILVARLFYNYQNLNTKGCISSYACNILKSCVNTRDLLIVSLPQGPQISDTT